MKIRPLVAGLAVLMAATASAAGADDVELVPATERINFNIGCQQSNGAPTCDTTEYWLGTGVGNNNVGTTGTATPLNYVTYRLGGAYTTTSFAGDQTLKPSYVLDGGSVIKGQIKLSGFVSGAEVGVDSGVFVELFARQDQKGGAQSLGQAEITKVVSTPVDSTYVFEFEVPEALEGVAIDRLSAEVGQRHITVLQNGFMNGKGLSYFDLPHLVPAS